MPFTEDLEVFVDPSEHGSAALWLAAGGEDPVPVNGIFDNGFASALDGVIADTRPRFTCSKADVEGIAPGDSLTVDGTEYAVATLEPDGMGWIVVRLREAA